MISVRGAPNGFLDSGALRCRFAPWRRPHHNVDPGCCSAALSWLVRGSAPPPPPHGAPRPPNAITLSITFPDAPPPVLLRPKNPEGPEQGRRFLGLSHCGPKNHSVDPQGAHSLHSLLASPPSTFFPPPMICRSNPTLTQPQPQPPFPRRTPSWPPPPWRSPPSLLWTSPGAR